MKSTSRDEPNFAYKVPCIKNDKKGLLSVLQTHLTILKEIAIKNDMIDFDVDKVIKAWFRRWYSVV